MDVQEIQVNAMKTKKELAFTDGWNKVPVFTDAEGTVVVDSTPIMSYIDDKYNQSKLSNAKGTERYDNMLEHVDSAWKNACLLYTSPSPRDRQKSRMPSSA